MTLTAPSRLSNAHLADIGHRLATPLNDDGYRAWYRQDVSALLEEVLVLRRERATAMAVLAANPPLEGLDQTTDLVEVAKVLATLWTEQQQGVWQRAEVKRIRDKLTVTGQAVEAFERASIEQAARLAEVQEQAAQLQAQLVDAINEGRHAIASAQQACADRGRRVTELLGQAAGILSES